MEAIYLEGSQSRQFTSCIPAVREHEYLVGLTNYQIRKYTDSMAACSKIFFLAYIEPKLIFGGQSMQEKAGGQSAAVKAGYGIASALLMAFCITIPVMLILAAVLTFTDFPEKYTTIAVVLATLSGLFAAGFRAGTGNGKNGTVRGGLPGLAYMVILYLVSSILFKDFMLSQRAIIMIITGLLAGAVGGLLGGNRKAKPLGRLNSFGSKSDSFRKYMK